MNLRGAHGTTKSRYNSIVRNGFRRSDGRAGPGIYFWAEGPKYKELARDWYNYCLAIRRYRNDSDRSLRIIVAVIEVESDQYVNLEEKSLKVRIYELAEAKKIDQNDIKQIAGVIDLFVRELEKEMKKQFIAISIRVAPPPLEYCPDYPIKLLGAPECLVVRGDAMIRIESVVEG